MKILMVLTSHDKLGNTGAKLASGSKNSRLHILSSETPTSI